MSNVLVIRLPGAVLAPETSVEWGLFDSLGNTQELGQTPLKEINTRIPQGSPVRVLILAPGETILLTQTSIPTRQSSQLHQALPFMIEEQLAADVERTHIATAPNREDDNIYVAVIDHSLLIQWLDSFYKVNLKPTKIISEVLAVPVFSTGPRVLLTPEKTFIRTAAYAGVCVDTANVGHAVFLLTNNLPEGNLRELDIACSVQSPVDQEILEQLSAQIQTDPLITIKRTDFQESVFQIMAATAIREWDKQLNLLQGGYKIRSPADRAGGGWWGVSKVASICLVVVLLTYAISGAWYSQRLEHYRNAGIELYRSAFPQDHRIISPRKQMQDHLKQRQSARSSGEFMRLLQAAAERIGQFADAQLQIQQASYNEAEGQLKLQLSSNKLDVFEHYRQSLIQAGFSAEMVSARGSGEAISGQLLLEQR